jgi:hypothetical protein
MMHVSITALISGKQTDSAAYKFTGALSRSSLFATLGGLLYGFDSAVIADTTHSLTKAFELAPDTR